MTSSAYTVTEPHPSVAGNSYMHSGRGGSGNFFRAPPSVTAASGVPSKVDTRRASTTTSSSTPQSASNTFYSGRGGRGNAHLISERSPAQLFNEDEFVKAATSSNARYYAGRGGAGNRVGDKDASSSKSKSRRDSSSTTSSSSSIRSGILARLGSHRH